MWCRNGTWYQHLSRSSRCMSVWRWAVGWLGWFAPTNKCHIDARARAAHERPNGAIRTVSSRLRSRSRNRFANSRSAAILKLLVCAVAGSSAFTWSAIRGDHLARSHNSVLDLSFWLLLRCSVRAPFASFAVQRREWRTLESVPFASSSIIPLEGVIRNDFQMIPDRDHRAKPDVRPLGA